MGKEIPETGEGPDVVPGIIKYQDRWRLMHIKLMIADLETLGKKDVSGTEDLIVTVKKIAKNFISALNIDLTNAHLKELEKHKGEGEIK